MTLTVDGNLFLVLLLVPLGLFSVLIGMPRWLFRSWGKHSLWSLRDEVVDDVLNGELPGTDAAVRELIARIEWAIQESRSFDLKHVIVWRRARRTLPAAAFKKLARVPDCDGMSNDQAQRVRAYRQRYDNVAVITIFTSSWLGWLIVARAAAPVVVRAVWKRASERALGRLNPRLLGWAVTEVIAVETPLGRSAMAFVDTKGPHEVPSAAIA